MTSANADRCIKFFHYKIPEKQILYSHIIKIFQLTLSMSLHYLVKLAVDFTMAYYM